MAKEAYKTWEEESSTTGAIKWTSSGTIVVVQVPVSVLVSAVAIVGDGTRVSSTGSKNNEWLELDAKTAAYVDGTKIKCSKSLSNGMALAKSMAAPEPTATTDEAPVLRKSSNRSSISCTVGKALDIVEGTVRNPNCWAKVNWTNCVDSATCFLLELNCASSLAGSLEIRRMGDCCKAGSLSWRKRRKDDIPDGERSVLAEEEAMVEKLCSYGAICTGTVVA
jgi:hypothetical protein